MWHGKLVDETFDADKVSAAANRKVVGSAPEIRWSSDPAILVGGRACYPRDYSPKSRVDKGPREGVPSKVRPVRSIGPLPLATTSLPTA